MVNNLILKEDLEFCVYLFPVTQKKDWCYSLFSSSRCNTKYYHQRNEQEKII